MTARQILLIGIASGLLTHVIIMSVNMLLMMPSAKDLREASEVVQ